MFFFVRILTIMRPKTKEYFQIPAQDTAQAPAIDGFLRYKSLKL